MAGAGAVARAGAGLGAGVRCPGPCLPAAAHLALSMIKAGVTDEPTVENEPTAARQKQDELKSSYYSNKENHLLKERANFTKEQSI